MAGPTPARSHLHSSWDVMSIQRFLEAASCPVPRHHHVVDTYVRVPPCCNELACRVLCVGSGKPEYKTKPLGAPARWERQHMTHTPSTVPDTHQRNREAGRGWISFSITGAVYTDFSTTTPKFRYLPVDLKLLSPCSFSH